MGTSQVHGAFTASDARSASVPRSHWGSLTSSSVCAASMWTNGSKGSAARKVRLTSLCFSSAAWTLAPWLSWYLHDALTRFVCCLIPFCICSWQKSWCEPGVKSRDECRFNDQNVLAPPFIHLVLLSSSSPFCQAALPISYYLHTFEHSLVRAGSPLHAFLSL